MNNILNLSGELNKQAKYNKIIFLQQKTQTKL